MRPKTHGWVTKTRTPAIKQNGGFRTNLMSRNIILGDDHLDPSNSDKNLDPSLSRIIKKRGGFRQKRGPLCDGRPKNIKKDPKHTGG